MKLTNPYKVPPSEIQSRTQKIQQELQLKSIDGLFIVQRVDLFYFSGTAQNGFMYIPCEGDLILFIKQYLPRARKESSVANKVSFIGHGIGLELIEPHIIAKNKTDLLAPGMTFALEPKFVYENEFTAGVESVFVVTANGARLVSKVPVEVFVC